MLRALRAERDAGSGLARATATPRCPYCVAGIRFKAIRILENGRQICENCGHIIFPEDKAFWCPCQRCLATRFSGRIRKLAKIATSEANAGWTNVRKLVPETWDAAQSCLESEFQLSRFPSACTNTLLRRNHSEP